MNADYVSNRCLSGILHYCISDWDSFKDFCAVHQTHDVQFIKYFFGLKQQNHRITESQNVRGWKGPLWVI